MDLGSLGLASVTAADLPLLAAFLVGLVAAVGPCPLATNLAALAYTAQQMSGRRGAVLGGLLYTLGRAAGYTAVGAAILAAGARVTRVAGGLQDAADLLLGPFLVAAGLVLLGLVRLPWGDGSAARVRLAERAARWRGGGAFALGFLFALAFCPYSAALFFGLLVPLALTDRHGIALPAAFGVGTAMPVLVLGVPLALGLERAARGVDMAARIETGARRTAGALFVLAGLYSLFRAV